MVDQYGCAENDFICKVNARQAEANQPTAPQPVAPSGGGAPSQPYTPLTQEQKDYNLADTVAQNQQARNSWSGQSNNEMIGNAMGIPMSVANVMQGGSPIVLGTMARGAGNLAQGINPFNTTDTFDWYKGDTNSQGNPTGPTGSFDRGMQGAYGNQYEKNVVGMFGVGSPEHFNAIAEQFDNTPTVEQQGGWLSGVVEGLLGAIGSNNSSDDDNNITGGGGSNGGGASFHGSDFNWN